MFSSVCERLAERWIDVFELRWSGSDPLNDPPGGPPVGSRSSRRQGWTCLQTALLFVAYFKINCDGTESEKAKMSHVCRIKHFLKYLNNLQHWNKLYISTDFIISNDRSFGCAIIYTDTTVWSLFQLCSYLHGHYSLCCFVHRHLQQCSIQSSSFSNLMIIVNSVRRIV